MGEIIKVGDRVRCIWFTHRTGWVDEVDHEKGDCYVIWDTYTPSWRLAKFLTLQECV